MNNAVPQSIKHLVLEEIEYQSARAGDEYVDNGRAYRYSDEYNKENFDLAERQGCCGSSQSSMMLFGQKWIIGWNHGH